MFTELLVDWSPIITHSYAKDGSFRNKFFAFEYVICFTEPVERSLSCHCPSFKQNTRDALRLRFLERWLESTVFLVVMREVRQKLDAFETAVNFYQTTRPYTPEQ
jgi:hypothetical protein